ncbi:hypothetical protein Tco_0039964 [Tanacetum coccineum]
MVQSMDMVMVSSQSMLVSITLLSVTSSLHPLLDLNDFLSGFLDQFWTEYLSFSNFSPTNRKWISTKRAETRAKMTKTEHGWKSCEKSLAKVQKMPKSESIQKISSQNRSRQTVRILLDDNLNPSDGSGKPLIVKL